MPKWHLRGSLCSKADSPVWKRKREQDRDTEQFIFNIICFFYGFLVRVAGVVATATFYRCCKIVHVCFFLFFIYKNGARSLSTETHRRNFLFCSNICRESNEFSNRRLFSAVRRLGFRSIIWHASLEKLRYIFGILSRS